MNNASTHLSAWLAMALMAAGLSAAGPCTARAPELRLYVLDCGHATFKDMGGFSDTGEYD
ncbi:MAG: hypothetical protein QOD56_633, partial [Gammaproteobacteria bacterium]|nr:hypothetical protein [Gammaproteobacteria bacterium]